MLPKFVGPFPVTQVFSKGVNEETIAVRLQLPESWKIHDVFHVSLVSLYRSDGSVQPPPSGPWIVDQDLFSVDRLIDHRRDKRKKLSYFVKWQGPGDTHTWEEASTLAKHVPHLVKDHWDSLPL